MNSTEKILQLILDYGIASNRGSLHEQRASYAAIREALEAHTALVLEAAAVECEALNFYDEDDPNGRFAEAIRAMKPKGQT